MDNGPQRDRANTIFFGVLALAGLVYVSLSLTPSSYGVQLQAINATGAGPILGTPRPVRSDEWAVTTPLMQAAVRNNFRELNETSFYRESLRSVETVPLWNWSLVFRPQFWAFFVLPPATAFSIFYAILIGAFLSGYYLLFRELGADGCLATAATLILYFCGFVQFFGQWYLAGVPWLVLIVLKPMPWWRKALLFVWLMPVTVLLQAYPAMFIDLAFAVVLLLLAVRRDWFRAPGGYAAVAIGGLATTAVVYGYFAKLIPIMQNTVYPGHRISPPGTVHGIVALSQLLPFAAFQLSSYEKLIGLNIVEIGTIGSFLPLLTLCLLRFGDFWRNRKLRLAVVILLAGAATMTLWQLVPLPRWIGKVFLWEIADPERLFCATGLLLTLASVMLWSNRLVVVQPLRLVIFVVAGPVAAVILKASRFQLEPAAYRADMGLAVVAAVGCAAAYLFRVEQREKVLLILVVAINLYGFGRFNPLQRAVPIFALPETGGLQQVRDEAAATPGHILLDGRFTGATLNGMGFRAVNHVLPVPQLNFFRQYFPTMEATRFNQIFNRFAHIVVTEDALPNVPQNDVVRVPREAFEPVRNLRTMLASGWQQGVCSLPVAGAVEEASGKGAELNIRGWALWKGEGTSQGLRVVSRRPISADLPQTGKRPDIGEILSDYGYARAGFRLRVVSSDGRPLALEDVVLVATGTTLGEIRVGGSGCH